VMSKAKTEIRRPRRVRFGAIVSVRFASGDGPESLSPIVEAARARNLTTCEFIRESALRAALEVAFARRRSSGGSDEGR
jgi:hypothetical protein